MPDDPETPDRDDEEDADRKAILARRSRFIALALSGLTTAAGGCYESHTAGTVPPGRDGGEMTDTGTPLPCLSRPLDAGPSVCLGAPIEDAGPTPCLDFAPEDAGLDGGLDATVTPGPCLSAPLEDGGSEDA